MDDGDGPRSSVRRRAPARDGQPLRAAVVAVVAAGILAAAVLAVALAPPPASAVAPAQAEPAGPVEPTEETAETAGTPGSGGDSRALAWWMAGEVGVLVIGGAIWCRRATRRQAARVAPVHAETPATPVEPSGRKSSTGRTSPRYRL